MATNKAEKKAPKKGEKMEKVKGKVGHHKAVGSHKGSIKK